MQFRVTIPSHIKSGQVIRIRCPDGTEGDVKVPTGLRSGDSFVFEMPDNSTTPEIRGFLDREIVNLQDFVMALGVGLLIGLSIVAGFLLGILHVTTTPIDRAQEQAKAQHAHQLMLMKQARHQQQPQMRMPNSGEF